MANFVFDKIVTGEEIKSILQKHLGLAYRMDVKKNRINIALGATRGCRVSLREEDGKTFVRGLVGYLPSGVLTVIIILGLFAISTVIGVISAVNLSQVGIVIVSLIEGWFVAAIIILIQVVPSQSLVRKVAGILGKVASVSDPKSFSPLIYVLIMTAFFSQMGLGLGVGYLLWGQNQVSAAAGTNPVRRVDVSTDDDPSIGPADAPVTIIEFSDYQCPYCQVWYGQVYQQLLASYPDKIRFVYRDLALPMHPEAVPAAEAANCAGEQNAYWKFHDALFTQQYGLNRAAYDHYATDLGLNIQAFDACLDSHRYQGEIQADAEDAARVGISGTPSFVVNGRILVGALPFSDFKTVIDEELAAKP